LEENNKVPLISIITIVYNGKKYIEQTIQSVINQTYKNIEYIIIDGGSIDGTLDIIKQYEEHISYWVSEPDKGLYDAMNKGIGIAKGKLIGMINSDDWYELDAVEIMAEAYKDNPTKSIFHADRYDIDDDGNRTVKKFHPSAFKFKYYGMTYHHPSMFITKDEYKKHLYNIKLIALSDYQFILEAFLKNPDSIYYLNKVIVNYRLDGVSANRTLFQRLKEGYISRKNVNIPLFQRLFAFMFGMAIAYIFSIKKLLRT